MASSLPADKPADDPWIGQKVDGRYAIERLIGEGGTGRVYQARQEATGRLVAVKLLRDSLLKDEASVRRFQREARAASRINHANAIIVHDSGRTLDGHCYLVTELIQGETLKDKLERDGLVAPAEALKIFHQILAGVAAAHEQGVVHRDLHPGNIFLCRDSHGEEHVKVFDFGGARMLDSNQDSDVTAVGALDLQQLLGSIRYLSPERLQRDRGPDPRGDVYSLGLILFELCTGHHPFSAADPLQVMAMHLREPPPLLSLWCGERWFAPTLQGLITSMLAKDPLLRPQDAGEVARRLQAVEARDTLITVMREVVPEPEVEMEMVAEPADEGDAETLPIPRIEPPPPAPAARPRLDTLMELEPLGVAPVRAVAPEPRSLPDLPLPASLRPRRGDRRVMAALVWLIVGAAGVFAAGTVTYQLYHRSHAVRRLLPISAPTAEEPPPAPLRP